MCDRGRNEMRLRERRLVMSVLGYTHCVMDKQHRRQSDLRSGKPGRQLVNARNEQSNNKTCMVESKRKTGNLTICRVLRTR